MLLVDAFTERDKNLDPLYLIWRATSDSAESKGISNREDEMEKGFRRSPYHPFTRIQLQQRVL